MFPEQDLEEDIVFEKDEELKETEEKIGELLKTKERTLEQEKELTDLKKNRQGKYDQRFKKISSNEKAAKYEAQKERERANKAEAEKEELKKRLEDKERLSVAGQSSYETITIGGKQFYTDKALNLMVAAGKMTQDDAWQHHEERVEEKAVNRLKEEEQKKEFLNEQKEEINWILDKYPTFDPKHPKHNPNDPIFVEANRILKTFSNGGRNFVSLKTAVEEAEKIIGKNIRPDASNELGVAHSNNFSDSSKKSKTAELTENEVEQAVNFYCYGGRSNPTTGKPYTHQEAIQKAMKVKQDRLSVVSARR